MSTSIIIQQHSIIQRSYSTINDYNSSKAEAEARLKREKEAIEGTWKRARDEASASINATRQAMRTAQDAIKKTEWRDKVGGDIPGPPPIVPAKLDFVQQMTQCQSTAELTCSRILDFLKKESTHDDNVIETRLVVGVVGFAVGFLALILIAVLLPSVLNPVTGIAIPLVLIILPLVLFGRQPRQGSNLKNDYASIIYITAIAEELYKQQLAALQPGYERQLNECQARHTEMMRQLDQRLAGDLAALQHASTALTSDIGVRGLSWDDPAWRQWQPPQTTNAVTRLGTLNTGLHRKLPQVPAFIACPGGENVLFEAAGDAKNTSTAAIQSLMLRLLATQPPGKIRFTLIDPIGLGQNVATFMQLADYDEKLVSSRAWTESRHIEQQLADLSEHMENVIQKYLRGQYKTIEEYNEQAGEVAEPYRVLVVMGFPVNFTEETARRLVKIATNGPRCGVCTIVMLDTEQPLPYGFNLKDLRRAATVIAWDGQRFVWHDKDFEKCQLSLDTPPALDLFNGLLKAVGSSARGASEVRVPFERIAPRGEEWWKGSTREGLKVPLGRAGATKLQYFDLGKGTSQQVLVVGKTGSGKTTLLHVLVANLALTYSPDELELYLVDFKTVGFTPYATYTLPHARAVATESEREFGLSVLQELDTELERRKKTFRKADTQDIVQYRGVQPNVRMPRILLLVDEFQEFFTQDDKVAQDATLLLDRIVRQGRAFGIHVILGSQTLAGAYTLARSTISQMAVRIALQCEEADSRLVLSDENPAARLISRPGEAIYNAANGLVEGNNPFQCSWLPDEQLDTYLKYIQRFAQQRRYVPSWKQIVFDGSKNADVAENTLLQNALKTPAYVMPQNVVPAWIGDPIAIKDPTAIPIRSQAGNNLLIVGQQEEIALGMLITVLVSLTTQYAPSTARFYVVDFSPVDAPFSGLLNHVGQMLPHDVKIVNRRGLFSVVSEVADEVQDRMEADGGKKLPIYLFIYGLHRARDLRPNEDFSFSSFGTEPPAAPSPSKQFSTILREGPELGVHTFAWCDTLTNLNRTLERGALREFEIRVVFQMSQEDSVNLVDSPLASKLGSYRALLFSEETGRVEKFRPYGQPTEEWLQQAATYIRQKR